MEEELLEDFKEWLRENIPDEGEVLTESMTCIRDENDIDTWAHDEYGSWSTCLSEYGYYPGNPDGEGGGLKKK